MTQIPSPSCKCSRRRLSPTCGGHRITVWKRPWEFSSPNPAQSKVNTNRPCFSMICQVQPEEAAPMLTCPHREKKFLISSEVGLLHTVSSWNTSHWARSHQERIGLCQQQPPAQSCHNSCILAHWHSYTNLALEQACVHLLMEEACPGVHSRAAGLSAWQPTPQQHLSVGAAGISSPSGCRAVSRMNEIKTI